MPLNHMTDDQLSEHIRALYEEKMRIDVGGVFSFGGRQQASRIDRLWKEARTEQRNRLPVNYLTGKPHTEN